MHHSNSSHAVLVVLLGRHLFSVVIERGCHAVPLLKVVSEQVRLRAAFVWGVCWMWLHFRDRHIMS